MFRMTNSFELSSAMALLDADYSLLLFKVKKMMLLLTLKLLLVTVEVTFKYHGFELKPAAIIFLLEYT